MKHPSHRGREPVRLRRIEPAEKARHRLAYPYRTQCRLPEGGVAELLIRADDTWRHRLDEGLPLSTRFGPVTALDYGPVLLACTGIDIADAPPSTRRALARYAFAALAPAIQAALGDPMVCDASSVIPGPATSIAVHVNLRLPSVRLTMRLRMTAEGIHALLDSGPWKRVVEPPPFAGWLASIKVRVPLAAGQTTLPLVEYRRLAPGDVVCPETTSFDVAGRAVVRIASRRLRIRWLASHQCFEVEDMSDNLGFTTDDIVEDPSNGAAPADMAELPIRLSFSLGALSLTVGEIAALGRGSLLELEQGLPPTVKIAANGAPVGTGELVDLDGRLAVEITHWPRGAARSHTP